LSWKKSCSPAVKMKSSPQSTHLSTLSWNSMGSPFSPNPQHRYSAGISSQAGCHQYSVSTPMSAFPEASF
jgi:hypothetical protein